MTWKAEMSVNWFLCVQVTGFYYYNLEDKMSDNWYVCVQVTGVCHSYLEEGNVCQLVCSCPGDRFL